MQFRPPQFQSAFYSCSLQRLSIRPVPNGDKVHIWLNSGTDGLLVSTPSVHRHCVVFAAILSPLLLALTALCIMALAGLDPGSPPETERHRQTLDGGSPTSQAIEPCDTADDDDAKANATPAAQHISSLDRASILVALWIGIVTCIGVLMAAALANGVMRVAGMIFGAIAAGLTALWLIRIWRSTRLSTRRTLGTR
jgi:hypothetical protein